MVAAVICRQRGSAQRAALRKHLVLIFAFGAEVGWLMADPQLGAGESCLQEGFYSRGPLRFIGELQN
jgi:hypothetical protein